MSGNVKINRRLYVTADGSRVVEDGDPEAATLLCTAGGEVSHATAVRYGLLKQPEPEAEKVPEPDSESEDEKKAEPEKKTPPAANKAGRRPADKSGKPEGDK